MTTTTNTNLPSILEVPAAETILQPTVVAPEAFIQGIRAQISDPALQSQFDAQIIALNDTAQRYLEQTNPNLKANSGYFFQRAIKALDRILRKAEIEKTTPNPKKPLEGTIAADIGKIYMNIAGYTPAPAFKIGRDIK